MSKTTDNESCRYSDKADCVEMRTALQRVLKALVFRNGPGPVLSSLPLAQFRCLMDVHHHKGAKMADIASSLGIGMPALSQLIAKLVRKGLVDRVADAEDRRVVRLRTSPEATRVLSSHFKAMNQRMNAAAARLGPGDLSGVVSALNLLADAAEATTPESSDGVTTADNAPFLSKLPYLRP